MMKEAGLTSHPETSNVRCIVRTSLGVKKPTSSNPYSDAGISFFLHAEGGYVTANKFHICLWPFFKQDIWLRINRTFFAKLRDSRDLNGLGESRIRNGKLKLTSAPHVDLAAVPGLFSFPFIMPLQIMDPYLDVKRASLCIQTLLNRFEQRELIASESCQKWQSSINTKKEVKILWENNMTDCLRVSFSFLSGFHLTASNVILINIRAYIGVVETTEWRCYCIVNF